MPWFAGGGVEVAKCNLPVSSGVRLRHAVACFSQAGPWAQKFRSKGGIIHSLARPGEAQRFWNPFLFFRFLRLVRNLRPDLLVGCMFEGTLYAQLASRLLGIPYVHEDHWDPSVSHGWLARWNHLSATRQAKLCVTVSENAARYLRKALAIPRKKIRVIRNPCRIFPPFSHRFVVAAKKKLGLEADLPVIGTCCRLDDRHKRVSDLLRAVGKLSQPLQILIVGDGKDRAMLEDLAKKACRRHRVIFAGYRTDHRNFLASMDIFVSVPAYEAMGIAVAEAMAAALPCIVSKVGGLLELIRPSLKNSYGRVVAPCAPLALSKKIKELIDSPSDRRLLGNRARRRALKLFQAEFHRHAVCEAYLKAAAF